MKVKDVMTTDVVTADADAPFVDVARLLLNRDISGVPVIDRSGGVVGVISETDLVTKEAYPPSGERPGFLERILRLVAGPEDGWLSKARGLKARDVMSGRVFIAEPDETIHEVTKRMIEEGVRRLPVIEEGALVGIITQHDVLRVFALKDADLRAAVERLLAVSMYASPEADIEVSVRDGIVRLRGTVHYESDVRVAGALVTKLDGVVGIENELEYRERDPRRVSA